MTLKFKSNVSRKKILNLIENTPSSKWEVVMWDGFSYVTHDAFGEKFQATKDELESAVYHSKCLFQDENAYAIIGRNARYILKK